jgi:hypothetical protein
MKSLTGALFALGLVAAGMSSAQAGLVTLDMSDVPAGTLVVLAPYQSHGFALNSSSGGFDFNSPDTGNGASQALGSNEFYAGANALAAFAPATVTLTQIGGNPFSLLSIDLARNFALDPAPMVTFTGVLAGGGSVTESFSVTSSSPPNTFQTFAFAGFGDVTSVSWNQSDVNQGVHQFTNVVLDASPASAPEPASLTLFSFGLVGLAGCRLRRRRFDSGD